MPWSTGVWDRGWLGNVMLPAPADWNLVLLAMGSHSRLVSREGSRGPYFRKTPPWYPRRRIPDRRRDAETVGVTSVLFPSLITQSI